MKNLSIASNPQALRPGPAVLPANSNAAAPGYITFGDAAALLWRRKLKLLVCAFAGLLFGILLTVTQQRVYEAKTSVEVQMPNEDYLNRRQLNPVVEPGIILLEPFVQTQLKLIQTDTILMRAVDKLEARGNPDLSPPPGPLETLRARAFGALHLPLPRPSGPGTAILSRDAEGVGAAINLSILENVRKRLTVRTIGQTQIIELLYESSDPVFAANFLNALAQEYRAESRSQIVDASTQTAGLLSVQIQEMGKLVGEAEKKLTDFVGANSLMVSNDKESFVEAQLRQTQAALGTAHEARVAEQSRYETVRNADPEMLAKVLDNETLRAYRVRLTELEQKRAEAVELYKPAHYAVRQIEAEIKEVQSAFERERAGVLARLRDLYQSAQFREDSLRKDYEQQAGVVAAQVGKSIRYTALKRDLDTKRQLHEAMLQKVEEAGLVSAMQASNVRVLDPAVPPVKPIKPNKLLYSAIGLGSGVFSGLLLLLIGERREQGQISANLRGRLESPRLGSIPNLTADTKKWPEVLPPENRQLVPHPRPQASKEVCAAGTLELTAFRRKDSDGARAFEALVKQVLFSAPRAKRLRVITLTSACHGEGRTTVLCNLGAALARTGRVVLLIDGDRINPRLHDIFGIPNETGLTDLIAAQTDGGESAASESVWMTEVPGLFVLPGGRAMGRLATLVHDPRASTVLDGFCRDFDVILVDAPPVLSPGDARGLSQHSDAVILVSREGCASPELVAAAESQMDEDGVPVAGRILNCVEMAERASA